MTYALFCILWAKPNVKLIEVPEKDYYAQISESFNGYQFESSTLEEKINSVKITHVATGASTEANASRDYQQKSFYLKLDLGENQASLDCSRREVIP